MGKSTFIESLNHPDYPVLTLIASLHDPTDFNGLPMLVDGKVLRQVFTLNGGR
ncbi:MAG: hypothetical protein RMJ83_03730 [Armatimonadota bacterium]|nr:hypothetical protein [Armatimonadota bacterium]